MILVKKRKSISLKIEKRKMMGLGLWPKNKTKENKNHGGVGASQRLGLSKLYGAKAQNECWTNLLGLMFMYSELGFAVFVHSGASFFTLFCLFLSFSGNGFDLKVLLRPCHRSVASHFLSLHRDPEFLEKWYDLLSL